jgi:hypothetical protein
VIKYRPTVINMCTIFEEGLAAFIKSLGATDEKGNTSNSGQPIVVQPIVVPTEANPKRRRITRRKKDDCQGSKQNQKDVEVPAEVVPDPAYTSVVPDPAEVVPTPAEVIPDPAEVVPEEQMDVNSELPHVVSICNSKKRKVDDSCMPDYKADRSKLQHTQAECDGDVQTDTPDDALKKLQIYGSVSSSKAEGHSSDKGESFPPSSLTTVPTDIIGNQDDEKHKLDGAAATIVGTPPEKECTPTGGRRPLTRTLGQCLL